MKKFNHRPRVKSTTVHLPVEQQQLLVSLLPKLKKRAESLHYKMMWQSQLCTPDDLVNESVASMMTTPRFPPPEEDQLLAWGYVVLRSKALTYLEKRQHEAVASMGYLQEQEYRELGKADIDRLSFAYEVLERTCSPAIIAIIQLFSTGMEGPEVAQTLGIPHATVRTRVRKARMTVQAAWANSRL